MDKENLNVETKNGDVCTDISGKEDIIKDETAARKEEIRKEDNNKVGLFSLILVLSGFLGGVLGAIGVGLVISMEKSGLTFVEFWNQQQRDFAVPASFLLIILDVIFIIISFSYLSKAKKLWKSAMDEDEKYDAVDKKLSLSIIFTNVTYFINFAFLMYIYTRW